MFDLTYLYALYLQNLIASVNLVRHAFENVTAVFGLNSDGILWFINVNTKIKQTLSQLVTSYSSFHFFF